MMDEGFRHRGYDRAVAHVVAEEERLFAYGDDPAILLACEKAVAELQAAVRQDPWTRPMLAAAGWSNAVFVLAFAEVYARAGRGFSFN